jgi:hypothetical protein
MMPCLIAGHHYFQKVRDMKNTAALAIERANDSPIRVKGETRLKQLSKREQLPRRFKRPRTWRPWLEE